MNLVKNGRCEELFQEIPDGAVDLILTDPPYGIMAGQGKSGISQELRFRTCDWDLAIDPAIIFKEAERILRPNGRLILFCMEPYTSKLINFQTNNVQYNYKAYWLKNGGRCPLGANKNMMPAVEEILIYTKTRKYDVEDMPNPLRNYFADVLHFIGLNSAKEVNEVLGHRRAEHAFYVTEGKQAIKDTIGGPADHCCRVGSSQWSLCTEATYQELIDWFEIDKMPGFKPFAELKEINQKHLDHMNRKYGTTFNLWEGRGSKTNVLQYKRSTEGFHPTQKPTDLLRDLIQTFSNPGDTIMDFTMGSGSTWVAAIETGRDFIGFEQDPEFFKIANERAETAWNKLLEAEAV